ncbi:hypothetical protein [Streptomyces sp. NBC_01351]|uniref:hypothetical protein n=1 Tax=Streptomyces sp. NBC_01351 TaxID=2903833 RepID=UPI002E365089|nr:hypothetical protein [Streptomyces sp. NBC_01351]
MARTVGPPALTWLLLVWGIPGWLLLGAVLLAASYGMGPAVCRAGASHRGGPAAGVVVEAGVVGEAVHSGAGRARGA